MYHGNIVLMKYIDLRLCDLLCVLLEYFINLVSCHFELETLKYHIYLVILNATGIISHVLKFITATMQGQTPF